MKKVWTGVLAAMLALVALLSLTACDDSAKVLSDARAAAAAEIHAAFDEYDQADYSAENFNLIVAARDAGLAVIDEAKDIATAEKASADAIALMAEVKTLAQEAQELAAAKTAAKTALSAAVGELTETEYRAANWTQVTNFKDFGNVAIDVAETLSAVESAKNKALADIAGVKDIAEEIASYADNKVFGVVNRKFVEYATIEAAFDAGETETVYLSKGKYEPESSELVLDSNVKLFAATEGVVFEGKVLVSGGNSEVKGIHFKNANTNERGDFRIAGPNFTMTDCIVEKTGGGITGYSYVLEYAAETGTLMLNDTVLISALKKTAEEINVLSPSVIGSADRWNHDASCKLVMQGGTIRTNGYGIFDCWQEASFQDVVFEGLTDADVEGLGFTDDNPMTMYMANNTSRVTRANYTGCTFRNIRSWGILAAGDNFSLLDCEFVDCLSRQVSFAFGEIKECLIWGNTFDLSKGYGIKFEGAVTANSTVTIKENTFKNCDITIWEDDSYCFSNDGETIVAEETKFLNCNAAKKIAAAPFDKVTLA